LWLLFCGLILRIIHPLTHHQPGRTQRPVRLNKNRRMRKIIFFVSLLLVSASVIQAQTKDYNVVFDLSSKDTINHQTVIREITLIKKANPQAKLEVVVYGQGLDLVVKDKSTKSEAIQELLKMENVSFKVCAMTMQRNNVEESQLVAGVRPVPDGIFEIVSKQQDGWGYIKVAH